jgi:hypothetical protein
MAGDEEKPPLSLVPEIPTFEKQLHETEMGQRVHVDRNRKVTDGPANEAAHNLMTIGQYLKENDHGIKHCRYMGSAAVHIYQSEALGEVFFFTQVNTLCRMPELTASNAMTELMKRAMEYYGRKIPTKRSGW